MPDNDKPEEQAQRSGTGASELVDRARKAVAEGLESAGPLYGDALKEVTKLIRKHPLEAMAVTFGIGCLIGTVLTRRR